MNAQENNAKQCEMFTFFCLEDKYKACFYKFWQDNIGMTGHYGHKGSKKIRTESKCRISTQAFG